MSAETWNLDVTNNQISYTNYGDARISLIDAYSAGIYYDRWNWQSNAIGAPRGDVLLLDPKTKFLSLVPTPGEIAPQYQTTVISSDDVAATAALKGSHEQGALACSS